MQISDEPLGSRANPLAPNLELVGTVDRPERSGRDHGGAGRARGSDPIWLFSSATLKAVPALHEEVTGARPQAAQRLPDFLVRPGIGGVRRVEWLVVLGGIPLFFLAAALLNRLLVAIVRPLWRRFAADPDRPVTSVLPMPARLLLFALLSQWVLPDLPLSLRVRQFWSSAGRRADDHRGRLAADHPQRGARTHPPAPDVARRPHGVRRAPARPPPRAPTSICVFAGLAVMLRHFGIDPTPTLAGVGVGGIAVALAAQKTLENVIAGASLIFDQAVKVGDFLKIGDVMGTVDHIGLRSTRIRTRRSHRRQHSQRADRRRDPRDVVRARQVLVPPGSAAALRHDAGAVARASSRDAGSCSPRINRCASKTSACASTGSAPYSLDIEIFAYVQARDWDEFLQVQEQLLFGLTEVVERAGTALALPSQTTYVGKLGAWGNDDREARDAATVASLTAVR